MRLVILLFPWLELFGLISLGVETSALTAVGYVFLTLCLGVALLRYQGMGMLQRLRDTQTGSVLGPQLLLDDMVVGFAAILLIIPGLLTDVFALLVLIGPVRRRLARFFGSPAPEAYRPAQDGSSQVTVEGSYTRVDDETRD